jgi:RHS repeat-associated protein
VLSSQDYFPFGMVMTERSFQENQERKYRWGFNGMEEDPDMGEGMLDFEARGYNSQICRFTSVDRQEASFPSNSPYSYCFNNPMLLVDTSGEYPISPAVKFIQESTGVKLSPAVAGVIDGLIEGNSIFAALKLGKDMLDPAKRQQMIEAAVAIAGDPIGFIKTVAKEEYEKIKNIAKMNEDGQYELGAMVGEKVSNALTGGFLAIAGKFVKSIVKPKAGGLGGKSKNVTDLDKVEGNNRLRDVVQDNNLVVMGHGDNVSAKTTKLTPQIKEGATNLIIHGDDSGEYFLVKTRPSSGSDSGYDRVTPENLAKFLESKGISGNVCIASCFAGGNGTPQAFAKHWKGEVSYVDTVVEGKNMQVGIDKKTGILSVNDDTKLTIKDAKPKK